MHAPRRTTWLHPLVVGLAILCGAVAGAAPYVARPVLDFEFSGPPPLRKPTAVAVDFAGNVFVADGVNDRVLQFDAAGNLVAEIGRIGEEPLARPISIKVDRSDRLWIADTGHQRVLVRGADGALTQTFTFERGNLGRAPDLTDVAPAADGLTAWTVDNDNHRLVQIDLATRTQTVVGGKGESLGQFDYPFMIALGRDGDLFVTDVINGRVQILSAAGRPVGRVGSYGPELGQLLRPKGVVCDAEGNVWVTDGILGVVQIFTPTGALRDVLRTEDGHPLKLDFPVGLALDAQGSLYVAELQADRVRKLAITVDRQALAPSPPNLSSAPSSATQARACTICHLDWLDPFAQGRGTVLMSVPVSTPQQPVASRGTMCLTCHDGSVLDSRRRVWQEHGHSTGVVPPAGMTVPERLPLVDGRLACRTCHSAHVSGGPTSEISGSIFLRVQNTAGELCASCHPDKTRGPGFGTHPTGGMPWPVPQSLIDAGARVGGNPRELTCQVCHTPHGASHEHLLVLGTESNQLCLSCHAQMRPGMFREGAAEHPLSPICTPEQVAAIREMGTQVGPENRLICLSCHKLHHGKGERYMLADDLRDGRMCLRCHAERQVLVGTAHDLRTNHPEEKNRLGMTPEMGGPCSACHLFHRYARAPEADKLDPGGKCITCHQPGGVAENKVLASPNHPQARCVECHNPHDPRFGRFLAAQPSDVCRKCHADRTALVGGPHDISRDSPAWPAVSTATHDACLACHRPHGNEETGLFRDGLAKGVSGTDAKCLPCHAAVAPGGDTGHTLMHPRDVAKLKMPSAAPLADVDGTKRVACRSCHDPHDAPSIRALLRVATGQTAQDACLACHTEAANVRAIGHAPDTLRAAGLKAEICRPCHAVHDDPQAVEARYLWPRQLEFAADSSPLATAANRHCLACHHEGGPVAPPAIATHPQQDMFNPTPPDAPGFLPLFNERGEIDPKGSIGCRTCHLTHGRATPVPLPPEVQTVGARELRARVWHIRVFTQDSVCTTCHGADALRRFMYFHNAARRSGPIQPTGGL